MPEKTGGHTRREVLKFAAISAISAGVPSTTSGVIGEQSHAGPAPASPSAKVVHDLSKLSWMVSGCVPFFDEFAKVRDIRAMDIAEAGPIPAPVHAPPATVLELVTNG